MKYKLQRLISYQLIETDKTMKLAFNLSNDIFFLDEKKFQELRKIADDNRYMYEKIPNVIIIDCAPHILEEHHLEKKMVKNYTENLGNKFFCAYLCEVIYE